MAWVKRALLASSAWMAWGVFLAAWSWAVRFEDGTGSQMGWVLVGFLGLLFCLAVSLAVSLALILIQRSKASPTHPVIDSGLFLANYSFSLFFMNLVINEGAAAGVLLLYGLPTLLPQTLLLAWFLNVVREKRLSAQA